MTYAPTAGIMTKPNTELKNIMIGLLMDMFDAEGVNMIDPDPKVSDRDLLPRLRITKAWPMSFADLPHIIVSVQGLRFSRFNVNYGNLGPYETDDGQILKMYGYTINGNYMIDVTGRTAGERDDVLQRCMDFLIWGYGGGGDILNPAGIDVWQYFVDRFIVLLPHEFTIAGDSEMSIGQTTDILFSNSLSIPFYAEFMKSSDVPQEVLEALTVRLSDYEGATTLR